MQLSDIIGDYQGFYDAQLVALDDLGFSLPTTSLSHLAYRVDSWGDYLEKRTALEAIASANVENIWRGRPISKILLQEPDRLGEGHTLEMIELIPPPHLFEYPMGLEHVAFVVREGFDAFIEERQHLLSSRPQYGDYPDAPFVNTGGGRAVKFYPLSLKEMVMMDGRTFDGFYHADWPQPKKKSESV